MKKIIATSFLGLLLLTGCGTFQKEIHVKMNRPIHIMAPKKTVALVTAHSASSVDLAIVSELAEKLKAKGVTIVTDPLTADYTIALAVPSKIKLTDEQGHVVELTALSTGLAGGLVAYRTTGSGNTAVGVGIASAAGGAILAYALKDSSLALQLDVVFSQNKEKPVIQQKTRLFSTVRQMHLDEKAGQLVLIDKLSTEIANQF